MKINRLLTLVTGVIILNVSLAHAATDYDAAILNDHPVSYWPMQETNGPTIYDLAGTNNGTLFTGTVTSGNGNWTSWDTNNGSAFGMGGTGFLFGVPNDVAIYFTNATATHIAVPYNVAMNTSNFTAEAWLRFPDWSTLTNPIPAAVDASPMTFDYNGGTQGGWAWVVTIGKSGTQPGRLDDWAAHASHAGWTMIDPGVNYNNQWIHAVETYDGTTLKEYINGVLKSSAVADYGTPGNGAPPLLMGAYNSGTVRSRMFQGGMSHVAIYTNALSANQILNHYSIGTLGSALPPSIGSEPIGNTNYVGYSQTLTVAAAGTAPLHYQWYKDTLAITGATNSSLVLDNLVLTNAGDYSVTVTNSLGSTNSSITSVGVLALPSNPYQATIISQFPQAYYPLNETEGTNAVDLINIGDNQASYYNFPTFGVAGASDNLGTAVALDGVTQGVQVNNPNAMAIVGNTTMEAWIMMQESDLEQVIIAHGPAIPNNPTKSSNTLGIGVDDEGNGFYYVQSSQQVFNTTNFIISGATYPIPAGDVGNWVHIVATADGTAWHLYDNGVDVADAGDTNGAVAANGGWAFGAVNGLWANPPTVVAPFLYGSINNVAIYNYALSPTTVLQHYQLGIGAVVTPAVSIQSSGGNITVSWTAGFLQQASSLNGPWTYVTGNSPHAVSTASPAQYFRATLQSPH